MRIWIFVIIILGLPGCGPNRSVQKGSVIIPAVETATLGTVTTNPDELLLKMNQPPK